jgi:two-component system phosphate regulon response regulator PhoB
MKILIIEDDRDIAELVEYNLKEERFQVEVCANGQKGLAKAQKNPPDLIVLDLMLPDLGGIEICKALKQDSKLRSIPVLMLTAKGEEVDRIVGFEVGAEDYITKPFSPRELVLRVKAVLKRTQSKDAMPGHRPATFGKLHIDPDKFEVKVGDQPVKLTALEFKLLNYLLEVKGRVATRDTLLDRVWGYDSDLNTRTVDTHIKRLREKLGEVGNYIETIRGLGYRFKE